MKVLYRPTASDDIVRQFRDYVLTAEAGEIAHRFREAFRRTIQSLGHNPHVGPRYSSSNPRLQNLRSWAVRVLAAAQGSPVTQIDRLGVDYPWEKCRKNVGSPQCG